MGSPVTTIRAADCLPLMDVPIMEDIRLSDCMRASGEVHVLKERVTTSAATFNTRGRLDHSLRILKCRTLYALGRDFDRLWDCYYPGTAGAQG